MAKFSSSVEIKESGYTVVQSTPYSLTIDVRSTGPSGNLFRSNSNGTYFKLILPRTHRSFLGDVDFERVAWLPHVLIANQDISRDGRSLATRISWNNGDQWSNLKVKPGGKCRAALCKDPDECFLNLHSVTTNTDVIGTIFSVKSVGGVLIGVGNIGRRLLPYEEGDVFVSTDGGKLWTCILDGAHHYRLIDQGSILVLVDNEKPTDKVLFSFDFGATIEEYNLTETIRVKTLITDEDSTSQNLNLFGFLRNSREFVSINFNLDSIFNRTCEDKDFESWKLEVNGECAMGATTNFQRIIAGKQCFVKRKLAHPENKHCPCTKDDFECDINYELSRDSKCTLVAGEKDPLIPQICTGKYKGSSGYRKIPGNQCIDGLTLDDLVEKDCPFQPYVNVTLNELPEGIRQSISIDSKVFLILLTNGDLYQTVDSGKTYTATIKNVTEIIQHEHFPTRIFARKESTGTMHYSSDSGGSFMEVKFDSIEVPKVEGLDGFMDFHPDEPNWLIFLVQKTCTLADKCHWKALITQNNGGNWFVLDDIVEKCLFSRDSEFKNVPKEMAFCTAYNDAKSQEIPHLKSYMVNENKKGTLLKENVIDYFVMHGFLFVAVQGKDDLSIFVSLDGKEFTSIQLPPEFDTRTRSFSIVPSSPYRAFLDILRDDTPFGAHGALFASNEKGDQYSLSLPDTNRGGSRSTVVDFIRVKGVSGTILANVVLNAEEIRRGTKTGKQLQTRISFNEGGIWERPIGIPCRGVCYVNLHLMVTVPWPSLVSDAAVPGVLLAVGNIGDENELLKSFDQGDTLRSLDGGRTWEKVANGPHRAVFADLGGAIALVPFGETSSITYLGDFARHRNTINFERSVTINYFLFNSISDGVAVSIFGKLDSGYQAIKLDFQHYAPPCDEHNDIENWSPADASGLKCSLGLSVAFPRRKKDVSCLIGRYPEPAAGIPCDCSVDDFDCDEGYLRNEAHQCYIAGKDPDRPKDCADGKPYVTRSGYRKISVSKCKGGLDLSQKVEKICGAPNENRPAVVVFHTSVWSHHIEIIIVLTSSSLAVSLTPFL
jgi:hypothetical protein